MNRKIAALLLFALSWLAGCRGPAPLATATPRALEPTLPPSPAVAATATTPSAPPPTAAASATLPPPTTVATATITPALIQLIGGGCCTQPFWSPDSRQVLFIDKSGPDAQTGIYGVTVQAPGTSKLVTARIANYTSDLMYALSPQGSVTLVEKVESGQTWRIQTGGRNVSLSPDRTRVVWNVTPETYPFENRVTTVMTAALPEGGGTVAGKKLTTVLRGGASGWLDDNHLLMNGRLSANSQAVTLFVLDLTDGSTRSLVSSERLRSVVPSRDGKWIVYTIAFESAAERNGTWLVPVDGSFAPRKLDWFGSFQWRGNHRLVYIPLQSEAASHTLYEYDVVSNTSRALTDPSVTRFKIANGDWAVSPDGAQIVFVNAADSNLWLLRLPP